MAFYHTDRYGCPSNNQAYVEPRYDGSGRRPAQARTFTPRTTGTASEASLRFMDSLTAQHPLNTLPAPLVSLITARNASPATFTPAQASYCIDALKALPRPQAQQSATPAEPAEIGFYLLDGEVYKVRAGKENPDRTYAMKLILPVGGGKGRFAYAPGAIRTLRAENRLTLDEACALGHATGVCMICGATLTDPASVTRGIGPVCASRL